MSTVWNGWKIVLASGSPRRKELMARIGIEPEIMPSTLEENSSETRPEEIVMELSRQKAEDIAGSCSSKTMVIGADTIVFAQGQVLGKPKTPERAMEMVKLLQGDVHQVYTGVTLILCGEDGSRHGISFAEKTDVYVYPMTEEEIRSYAECGEPLDKAGAYAVQGRFAAYIQKLDGSYDNVVGLPLGRLYQEMKTLTKEKDTDD